MGERRTEHVTPPLAIINPNRDALFWYVRIVCAYSMSCVVCLSEYAVP